MKKTGIQFLTLLCLLLPSISAFALIPVAEPGDSPLINFYRPAQSMMSGAQGLTVEIFIDGKKITDAGNGALVHYTTYKEGVIEVKIQKSGYGSVMGVPITSKITITKGSPVHILFEGTGSMGQVSMKEIDADKAAKLEKNTKAFPGVMSINEKDVK